VKKAVLLLSVLLASQPAWAQDDDKPAAAKTGSATDKHNEKIAQQIADEWPLTPVKEDESVTAHSVAVGGKTLKYHAAAGTVTIQDDDAKPTASVFYVAYTLDGAPPGTRPVTFFYNGGPGSSSVWLHMGSFAPVRVQTGSPESIRPAPYRFGPNPDTLLDKTDLVFLDAIGTGYSRPLGDTKTRTRTHVSIVAIVREKKVIPSPTPAEILRPGDVIVAVGTRDGLDAAGLLMANGPD
jgi:carboxypeptidase C (cathepsin A)